MKGATVYEQGGYVGNGPHCSNNVSEYAAFLAALTEAVKHQGTILIRGDSRLVICQLSREAAQELHYGDAWKVKGGHYMPYYQQAKKLYDIHAQRITLRWISRDDNAICDRLSKHVLKDRGIQFRIQPE